MVNLDNCNIGDIIISKGMKSFTYRGKISKCSIYSYLVSNNDSISTRTVNGKIFDADDNVELDDDLMIKLDDMNILDRLIYLTHNEQIIWYDAGTTLKAFNNGVSIRLIIDDIISLKIDSQLYGNTLSIDETEVNQLKALYMEILPRIKGRIVDLFFDGIKY